MDLNPAPMPSTSSNEDPPGKPLGSNRPQREKRTPVVLRGYLVGKPQFSNSCYLSSSLSCTEFSIPFLILPFCLNLVIHPPCTQ
ncbi:hypothetical protein GOBAR_DD28870 [Gossypium barbadense]|nr:hypothetical protein GOBAR_DD28870 [Gossypium barbadense]